MARESAVYVSPALSNPKKYVALLEYVEPGFLESSEEHALTTFGVSFKELAK